MSLWHKRAGVSNIRIQPIRAQSRWTSTNEIGPVCYISRGRRSLSSDRGQLWGGQGGLVRQSGGLQQDWGETEQQDSLGPASGGQDTLLHHRSYSFINNYNQFLCELNTYIIVAGQWVVDKNLERNRGGVRSVQKNETLWPSQVEDWRYWNGSDWLADPQLTVRGDQLLYFDYFF